MADGILGKLLSSIDNTKRVVGRNISDLISDPVNSLDKTAHQAVKTIVEYFQDPMNFVGGGAGIIAGRKAGEVLGLEKVMKQVDELAKSGASQHKIAQESSTALKEMRNPGQAMSMFIGPDNQLRIVIGNQNAKVASGAFDKILDYNEGYKLYPRNIDGAPLSDVLLHPSLYEISDRAATATIKKIKELGSGASYTPATNTIGIGTYINVPYSLRNDPMEEALRVLLHESGHGVQVEHGLRTGTADTTLALMNSLSAARFNSFSPDTQIVNMLAQTRKEAPVADLMDILRADRNNAWYKNNYGEWEAEFGAKMNPTAFPMMYERGKTW